MSALDASQIATYLSLIVGAGGLGSLAFLWPQIKKLQADTRVVERQVETAEVHDASVLSAAALAQMTAAVERAVAAEHRAEIAQRRAIEAEQRSEQRNAAMVVDMRQMQNRMKMIEHELATYRDIAQEHVAWDMNRIMQLRMLGAGEDDIPEAPPLLPPFGR